MPYGCEHLSILPSVFLQESKNNRMVASLLLSIPKQPVRPQADL